MRGMGHAATAADVAKIMAALGARMPGGAVSFQRFAATYLRLEAGLPLVPPLRRPQMDPALQRVMQEAFHEFDADHSGTISASEVESVLAKMGHTNLSDTQIAEMLVAMGAVVTLEQFKKVYYAQPRKAAPARGSTEEAALLQAFKDCDTDGSGAITADEMYNMIQRLGHAATKAQVAEMLAPMGALVSCRAFANVCTKQQQQLQAIKSGRDPAIDKALRNVFDEFDNDYSGMISAVDVEPVLVKMGQTNISDAEIAEMLVAMGAVVTLEQFKQVYYKQQGDRAPAPGSPAEAALLQAFKDFDTDGSNTITAEELHAMLQKLGHAATKVQ
eukprot:138207-Chlamydomonas_euryale.AAC.1